MIDVMICLYVVSYLLALIALLHATTFITHIIDIHECQIEVSQFVIIVETLPRGSSAQKVGKRSPP